MNAVWLGAMEEMDALGLGIISPAAAIAIASVFVGLIVLLFLKNR